jgi:hypothetical protein
MYSDSSKTIQVGVLYQTGIVVKGGAQNNAATRVLYNQSL